MKTLSAAAGWRRFIATSRACRMATIRKWRTRHYVIGRAAPKRLAIARSLLSDAELLILDEATSALDLETERQVQRNLDALRSEKTTIIIAHRLSTVENADLIYVLDKGKVMESGNHGMLMKSSNLYQILSAPCERTRAKD